MNTNGILIYADTLSAQPGTSYYYFQIAEVDAGLNVCDIAENGNDTQVEWCAAVPEYRTNILTNTKYLYNSMVQIGISPSFGGTTFELYGADPRRNLINEHGGGAMQLSLYGAGTNAEHVIPNGSCGGYPDNTVFTPLMAVAANCGWTGSTNDIQPNAMVHTPTVLHMERWNPYQFTKKTAFSNLFWSQAATLTAAPYVQMGYHLLYSSSASMSTYAHPQELPAIWTAPGVSYSYYYVDQATDAIVTITNPSTQMYTRIPNRTDYPDRGSPTPPYNKEQWVGVCDQAGSRCLTVAVKSAVFKEISFHTFAQPDSVKLGYIGPHGNFALTPGTEYYFFVYVFPYKYDQVVGGKSVRQWIAELPQQ